MEEEEQMKKTVCDECTQEMRESVLMVGSSKVEVRAQLRWLTLDGMGHQRDICWDCIRRELNRKYDNE